MSQHRLTLFAVHAHPDDEIFFTGGVYSRADEQGMRTVLVTATRGEEGEILDPTLDPVEARTRLGEIREEELRRAAPILGIQEIRFLGYRDSGMRDTASTGDPRAFSNADSREAAGRVAGLLREIRPDVVVCYDPGGGYGHPDHIMASAVTTEAVSLSADEAFEDGQPPWRVPKFYWSANPEGRFEHLGDEIRKRGLPVPIPDPGYDMTPYIVTEDRITTRVDAHEYVQRKIDAMLTHRTQINEQNFFVLLPRDLQEYLLGLESFIRVHSDVPVPENEDDLFAGLR